MDQKLLINFHCQVHKYDYFHHSPPTLPRAIASAPQLSPVVATLNPKSPGTPVKGNSWPDLTAQWQQWVVQNSVKGSAVLQDKTGALSLQGQDSKSPIVFLVGSGKLNNGEVAVRQVRVEQGKVLSFPAVNIRNDQLNGKEEVKNGKTKPTDGKSFNELRGELDISLRTARGLVTVDGKIEPLVRVSSSEFTVTIPPNSIIGSVEGIEGNAVDLGLYAAIDTSTLSPGVHTIHIKGEIPREPPKKNFSLDVTYQITVVALPKK